MAKDGQVHRVHGQTGERPENRAGRPEGVDLAAFEERLKDARARRAVALANQRAAEAARAGLAVNAVTSRSEPPAYDPALSDAPRDTPRPPLRTESATMRPRTDIPAPRLGTTHRPAPSWPALGTGTMALIKRVGPRAAPLVGGFFVAGLLIGAAVATFGPWGEAPEVASAPEAVATSAPQTVAETAPAFVPAAAIPEPEAPAEVADAPEAATPPVAAALVPPAAPEAVVVEAVAPEPISTTLSGRPYPRPKPVTAPGEAGLAVEEVTFANGAISEGENADFADVEIAAEAPEQISEPVDEPETDPALAGVRVFVHAPPSVGRAGAESVVATLAAAGFPEVRRAGARDSVAGTNVRYFHAEDAAAAHRIATTLGDGAIARDFTSFRPSPRGGTLEVWLAGTAPPRRAVDTPEAILKILQTRAPD